MLWHSHTKYQATVIYTSTFNVKSVYMSGILRRRIRIFSVLMLSRICYSILSWFRWICSCTSCCDIWRGVFAVCATFGRGMNEWKKEETLLKLLLGYNNNAKKNPKLLLRSVVGRCCNWFSAPTHHCQISHSNLFCVQTQKSSNREWSNESPLLPAPSADGRLLFFRLFSLHFSVVGLLSNLLIANKLQTKSFSNSSPSRPLPLSVFWSP